MYFFQRLSLLGAALATTCLLFAASMVNASNPHLSDVVHNDSLIRCQHLRALANHLEFSRICDTVYVVGNRFIEVNLQTQRATVHFRNGDSLVIPISSGNIKLTEAISTPTGIFSIQSKTPEAISRQFDNTKMLWWIGFNYNVGFHGLEKDSYYKYLGVRPSSHGCVRTGREDVKKMYDIVELGDPVIVYDTIPARILAFSDTTTFDTTKAFQLGSRNKYRGKLMNERLQLLYDGKRIAEQQFALFIPKNYQLCPGGYRVGNKDSIIAPQEYPSTVAAGFMRSPRDVFFAETWFEKEKALLNPLPKDSVRADSTVFEPPPQPKRKRIKKVGSQH
jgi:hypothetical protein